MSFQSLAFFGFLAAALAVCLTAGRRSPRAGAAMLAAASAVFYLLGPGGWTVVLGGIACLLAGICVTACAIRRMARSGGRRRTMVLACVYHIAILVGFKYTEFLTGGAVEVGWAPLGLSFFTFQQLWLLKEVYTGEYVPAPGDSLLLYGLFFPTVTSGPILRPGIFFPQLREKGFLHPDWSDAAAGIYAICCGTIKKVLLADAVGALWTDIIGVADSPSTTFVGLANASTPLVWLGIIAYSLQLYFDFSGYSLMGIGMGKMLGFDFPANFNYPYISASITEFWRRWHMTLSGWFREYVYIPLGGNRKGLKRQILNLFIVELLTGIWHGANWNFICWGLYYFVLLAVEKLFLLPYLKKGKVWPHFYTLFLVVVGWAMFVGNDTGVSFGLLFQKLFVPSGGVSPLYFLRNYGVLLAVSVVCCTPLIEKLWDVLRKNAVTRCAAILTLLVVSTAYVVGSTNSPFLYFNF